MVKAPLFVIDIAQTVDVTGLLMLTISPFVVMVVAVKDPSKVVVPVEETIWKGPEMVALASKRTLFHFECKDAKGVVWPTIFWKRTSSEPAVRVKDCCPLTALPRVMVALPEFKEALPVRLIGPAKEIG